jgi:hypothetical protein
MTPAARSARVKLLQRKKAALVAAEAALMVAIYEATEDGLSQADTAYAIGDKSPTTIKAKALKGRAIKEGKR